jgi:hypothetical protein
MPRLPSVFLPLRVSILHAPALRALQHLPFVELHYTALSKAVCRVSSYIRIVTSASYAVDSLSAEQPLARSQPLPDSR